MACMNKGWEILSGKIKSLLKRKKGIENRDNSIAERWEILSGKNNWEGFFGLRSSTIPHSPWPNVSVGLDKNNPYKYDITKYVCAASDVPSKTQKVKESTWIGFVGVATDEGKVALGRREILIAWRGTRRGSEWNDDCENSLVQPTEIFGEKTNNILVHKVGEENFKEAYTLQILRISNASDPVPKLPERGLIDGFANDRRVYEDVGFELSIDTTKSKYLKKDVDGHILEVYLHGTAGTQGAKGEFKLEINRDIALKNKADDVLKDEYGVPVSWCIEKNKGMVQQEDGSWILMDHEDYDTYFLP
ncbi:putative phospholipase A1-II 1-like [Capsicum annuum]|uniref:Phospholipase A1 n=1 Tax=Capsicum annuum TaxID=4072 RepID=A0A2G3AN86_CAPAN|nr:putative phospholipase A1-II 1-like [Capsicum annuum]KAF3672263.1 putative phospholipase A1-II 1-like [Capsicum annuum]PHT95705.1 hypothetical protein T459_03587 [Capsicum annuum]